MKEMLLKYSYNRKKKRIPEALKLDDSHFVYTIKELLKEATKDNTLPGDNPKNTFESLLDLIETEKINGNFLLYLAHEGLLRVINSFVLNNVDTLIKKGKLVDRNGVTILPEEVDK